MSVNKVILIGRLGREPEIKETQGGKKYARFSIATSEKNKAGDVLTEWHNITAFGNVVDVIESLELPNFASSELAPYQTIE
jgi:single-strand DNA-binding protein